jgi:Flp pilus assembly protein TadG
MMNTKPPRGGRLRKQDGAAAVEFALIAGVLSMLVFGMMEYGLFFLQSQSLRSGAREGARQAAVGATLTTVKQAVSDGSAGELPASSAAVSMSVVGSTQTSCTSSTTDDTLGKEVQVTVNTSNYALLPGNIVEAFKIDVPFLPHVDLHPTIVGSFRCEQ